MKKTISVISLLLLISCNSPASMDAMCSNTAQIYGTWDIAPRSDISKHSSTTKMVLTGEGNYEFFGLFHNSRIESSKITSIPGYFIIASATSDNTGEYIHTARYNCTQDSFEGQTWSRGRNNLRSWIGKRADG